jgi:hypothetical protein
MRFAAPLAAALILTGLPTVASSQVTIAVDDPGPGWTRWHERRYERGWNGPMWEHNHGHHYGWYHWRGSYYQNCAWRWDRHHEREWHCW